VAATDFFLVIPEIKGESGDSVFKDKDAMDIQSFSWGLSNAGSMAVTGGGGQGRSSFQDIHFTKDVDKASPSLALKCVTGEPMAKATLHIRKAGGEQKEYYTVTLEDVMVSSYQGGGSAGNPILIDQFSLNFAKIHWEYKTQNDKGAMVAGGEMKYDLKARKA
jgi:type VI secretion system secreted protein Hcp